MKQQDIDPVEGGPALETMCSAHERTETCPAASSRPKEYVAPRNDLEAGVAEILGAVLSADRVGAHDNFIVLGGESLLAAQVAWRIQKRFGCEVSLRSILTGSVADIAAELIAEGCTATAE
jgi:acyl carrier protein